MKQQLLYEAVKIDGPKKKILEFNEVDKFMDDKDLKHFNSLCEALADKSKYHSTKLNDYHSALLDKLLALPIDKIFPCLDLYRIFLIHPDSNIHFKKFEDGMVHINTILGVLEDKTAGDPAKMLALRCCCNLFR